MRIGVDARSLEFPRAGIGRYLHRLLWGLAEMAPNEEFVLWSTAWRADAAGTLPAFPPGAIRHVRFPFPDRLLDWMVRTGVQMGFAAEQVLGPLDCFHHPSPLLVPLRGTPRVITIHDLWFLRHPEGVPQKTFRTLEAGLRREAGQAACIIADSEWTKHDVTDLLGIAAERVRVIPLAPDPAFLPLPAVVLRSVLARYGVRPGEYIIFVGTIEPRKNVEGLLRAYARWAERRGRRIPLLVLAGRLGWMYRNVERLLAEPRLQGLVRRLGYVPEEDLPALIGGAVACCHPSLYEGFGLPALEAMACGTPVLASNASALPEVLEDGALYIEPQDVEGMAEALDRLSRDAALRECLIRRGQVRAKAFSWERTARETLEVYRAAAGSGRE